MAEDTWVDFVAGWCSGATAVLVCQPVDTMLTRWQAQAGTTTPPCSTTRMATTTTAATTATTGSNNMFIWRDTRSLISHAGIRSLWRGSSCMISAVPLQNALLMSGYGLGTSLVAAGSDSRVDSNNDKNLLLLWGAFCGGTVGGIVQSFLMSPVELIKVQQQVHVNDGVVRGGWKTTQQVTRGLLSSFLLPFLRRSSSTSTTTSSSLSSWRGLQATLLRDGIPHGVWFASYQWCKDTMSERLYLVGDANNSNDDIDKREETTIRNSNPPVVVPLVSGAFAATVAWAVGYPFDLIKTRIQASTSLSATNTTMVNATSTLQPSQLNQPPSVWQVAVQIYHEGRPPSTSSSTYSSSRGYYYHYHLHGIRNLYRGFGLKLVRAIPASMIGFSVYEFVKNGIIEMTTTM